MSAGRSGHGALSSFNQFRFDSIGKAPALLARLDLNSQRKTNQEDVYDEDEVMVDAEVSKVEEDTAQRIDSESSQTKKKSLMDRLGIQSATIPRPETERYSSSSSSLTIHSTPPPVGVSFSENLPSHGLLAVKDRVAETPSRSEVDSMSGLATPVEPGFSDTSNELAHAHIPSITISSSISTHNESPALFTTTRPSQHAHHPNTARTETTDRSASSRSMFQFDFLPQVPAFVNRSLFTKSPLTPLAQLLTEEKEAWAEVLNDKHTDVETNVSTKAADDENDDRLDIGLPTPDVSPGTSSMEKTTAPDTDVLPHYDRENSTLFRVMADTAVNKGHNSSKEQTDVDVRNEPETSVPRSTTAKISNMPLTELAIKNSTIPPKPTKRSLSKQATTKLPSNEEPTVPLPTKPCNTFEKRQSDTGARSITALKPTGTVEKEKDNLRRPSKQRVVQATVNKTPRHTVDQGHTPEEIREPTAGPSESNIAQLDVKKGSGSSLIDPCLTSPVSSLPQSSPAQTQKRTIHPLPPRPAVLSQVSSTIQNPNTSSPEPLKRKDSPDNSGGKLSRSQRRKKARLSTSVQVGVQSSADPSFRSASSEEVASEHNTPQPVQSPSSERSVIDNEDSPRSNMHADKESILHPEIPRSKSHPPELEEINAESDNAGVKIIQAIEPALTSTDYPGDPSPRQEHKESGNVRQTKRDEVMFRFLPALVDAHVNSIPDFGGKTSTNVTTSTHSLAIERTSLDTVQAMEIEPNAEANDANIPAKISTGSNITLNDVVQGSVFDEGYALHPQEGSTIVDAERPVDVSRPILRWQSGDDLGEEGDHEAPAYLDTSERIPLRRIYPRRKGSYHRPLENRSRSPRSPPRRSPPASYSRFRPAPSYNRRSPSPNRRSLSPVRRDYIDTHYSPDATSYRVGRTPPRVTERHRRTSPIDWDDRRRSPSPISRPSRDRTVSPHRRYNYDSDYERRHWHTEHQYRPSYDFQDGDNRRSLRQNYDGRSYHRSSLSPPPERGRSPTHILSGETSVYRQGGAENLSGTRLMEPLQSKEVEADQDSHSYENSRYQSTRRFSNTYRPIHEDADEWTRDADVGAREQDRPEPRRVTYFSTDDRGSDSLEKMHPERIPIEEEDRKGHRLSSLLPRDRELLEIYDYGRHSSTPSTVASESAMATKRIYDAPADKINRYAEPLHELTHDSSSIMQQAPAVASKVYHDLTRDMETSNADDLSASTQVVPPLETLPVRFTSYRAPSTQETPTSNLPDRPALENRFDSRPRPRARPDTDLKNRVAGDGRRRQTAGSLSDRLDDPDSRNHSEKGLLNRLNVEMPRASPPLVDDNENINTPSMRDRIGERPLETRYAPSTSKRSLEDRISSARRPASPSSRDNRRRAPPAESTPFSNTSHGIRIQRPVGRQPRDEATKDDSRRDLASRLTDHGKSLFDRIGDTL